ncbi:MAG: phosphopentomutase [Candidatus Calescibacterium sp.]|nr:phosphopentomutase [Candidatus Calescibacterium sp.]MCX7972480.1 phosphopentomutase [bacterium]MDW8195628.1 phosphopentomutase [Candidatus Calescibacterium sp.]
MRVFLVILDGVGIGASKDCYEFNDPPTVNTLLNSLRKSLESGLKVNLSNLSKLGLHKILKIKNPQIQDRELSEIGFDINSQIISSYGIMEEKSLGKDTITGHWEIAGLILEKGFETYNSFPQDLIEEFEKKIGRKIIGNKAASGTEIIKELGEEHIRTGKPIVYTSADSVFQVAAHIEVIDIDELYKICQIAYDLINQKGYRIARVIARPFAGQSGNFYRLNDKRKDLAVPPPSPTILDCLYKSGLEVISVGKISDIFANKSITQSYKVSGNTNIFSKVIELSREKFDGLVFANLVDFDTVYGHRQDYIGFTKAIEEFDKMVFGLIENLREDDILIITADHGNDPTDNSTDHTREDVPIILIGFKKDFFLGIKKTFRYVSFIIQEFLGKHLKSKITIEEFEGEKLWNTW